MSEWNTTFWSTNNYDSLDFDDVHQGKLPGTSRTHLQHRYQANTVTVDPNEQHKDISSQAGYLGGDRFLRKLTWTPLGNYDSSVYLWASEPSIGKELTIVGIVLQEGLFVHPEGDFCEGSGKPLSEAAIRFSLAQPKGTRYLPYANNFNSAVRNVISLGAGSDFSTRPFLDRAADGTYKFNLHQEIFRRKVSAEIW